MLLSVFLLLFFAVDSGAFNAVGSLGLVRQKRTLAEPLGERYRWAVENRKFLVGLTKQQLVLRL